MPKKGKGKDKSAQARDKYESRKLKKELAKIGEDDIETILAQIKKKDAEKVVYFYSYFVASSLILASDIFISIGLHLTIA